MLSRPTFLSRRWSTLLGLVLVIASPSKRLQAVVRRESSQVSSSCQLFCSFSYWWRLLWCAGAAQTMPKRPLNLLSCQTRTTCFRPRLCPTSFRHPRMSVAWRSLSLRTSRHGCWDMLYRPTSPLPSTLDGKGWRGLHVTSLRTYPYPPMPRPCSFATSRARASWPTFWTSPSPRALCTPPPTTSPPSRLFCAANAPRRPCRTHLSSTLPPSDL